MQNCNQQEIIDEAIRTISETNPVSTDGEWLEELTVRVALNITEWDLEKCWQWKEWPEREHHGLIATDLGIDVVAVRRSDGKYVAIQCKSRQLDEEGRGNPIPKREIDSFASLSSAGLWAERWIVTNGDNPLAPNATNAIPRENPVKVINIDSDLRKHQEATASLREDCPHCSPDGEDALQTRSCMQDEAVRTSVALLKEHEQSESGGLPKGEARGKIILPCGTGKTLISLRIVEELTQCGQLAVILCPSIALVAQIRREYLARAKGRIRSLAVCSDKTAGYGPRRVESSLSPDDPTLDMSQVNASEVKGLVTTDSEEIAKWIREGQGIATLNIIFGTYQSSNKVGDALRKAEVIAEVLIADEAHRTAGLRRNKKLNDRLRDFTVCHDNTLCPARFRIYQTATPRVFEIRNAKPRDDWMVRNMDDETVFGVELFRKSYMQAVQNRWLTDYRIIALGVNDQDAYRAANELAYETQAGGGGGD